MLRALYSAATGMESQQLNLDVIANNLANVNTTGFKKSKIEFQDLLYDNTRAPGAEQGNGTQLPTGMQSRPWHTRGRHVQDLHRGRIDPDRRTSWTWPSRATAFFKCRCPMARWPTRATVA